MTEYIEREAAEELISQPITMSLCLTREECLAKRSQRDIDVALLHSIPAADVRPVVRGRWEKCVGENGVTSACRCSLCGFEDNRFSMFNYCPNCGAKMKNPEAYE